MDLPYMGLRFRGAKRIFFSFSFSRSYSNQATAGIQKYFFEDSKTNGKIRQISGPALHNMYDFQVTVPLTWSAVVQSLTFESAQQPLNRRYRLLRQFSISAVGYSADSSISTVQPLILNRNSRLHSGFIQENYIVHKRYRLHRGMTIGAVGYSASFESPQQPTALILNPCSSLQRGFIEIFKQLRENEREKKIISAS